MSNDLFAQRIADHGVLPLPLAAKVWDAGKYVAIDRQLGVPGSHWMALGEGKIGLALSAKGFSMLRETPTLWESTELKESGTSVRPATLHQTTTHHPYISKA